MNDSVGRGVAARLILVLLGVGPFAMQSAAQGEGDVGEGGGPFVTVDGMASLIVETYDADGDGGVFDDSVSRRPSHFTRLDLSPEFHIGGVSVPLRLGLSIGGERSGNAGSGVGNLLDPANSLGISPDFGWLRLHVGSHTPELSELAGSRRKLFGGGFELTLDSLDLRASYGISNRAAGLDTAREWRMIGYEERMATGMISYGLGVGRVGLNLVHAREDTTSIDAADRAALESGLPDAPTIPSAHEHLMLSLEGNLRFGRISLATEFAGSYSVGDISAPPIDSVDHDRSLETPIAVARSIGLLPRAFTLFDVAGRVEGRLGLGRGDRIDMEVAYTGQNFRSPGRPDLPGDRLRVALSPRLATSDRSILFTVRVSWERLNLFRPYDPHSDRWKGSADLLWSDAFGQEGFSLGGGYRHYRSGTTFTDTSSGFAEDAIDRFSDTSSLHTLQLNPTHVIRSTDAIHVVGSMLSFTTGSGGSGVTRRWRQGFGATAIYSLSLVGSVPLNVNTSLTWSRYELSTADATAPGTGRVFEFAYSTLHGTLSLAYRFSRPGKNELSSRIALSRSAGIDGGTASPIASSHTSFTLLGRWRPTKQLLLHLELRRSRYDFSDLKDRGETIGRAGVEWVFG